MPHLPSRSAATLAAILAGLCALPLQASDVVVDSAADVTGDDLECTLREALENLERLHTSVPQWNDCRFGSGFDHRIIISPGLPPIELNAPLQVTRTIEIIGPNARQTIQPAPGMSSRLIEIVPNESGRYVLSNLQLSGARTSTYPNFPGVFDGLGGAMLIDGAFFDVDVELTNLYFLENRILAGTPQSPARSTGGGALNIEVNSNSSVLIKDSIFSRNSIGDASHPIGGLGGAILSRNSSLTILRSSFVNNSASYLYNAGEGAAVYLSGGSLTLRGSSLTANPAPINGSTLTIAGANALIFDSLFNQNSGRSVLAHSGNMASLVLSNSMFSDNQATPLRLSQLAAASVSASSIVRNQVLEGVAGIDADSVNLDIVGSTLAYNQSMHATGGSGARTGALRMQAGRLLLEDASLIRNATQAAAGNAASGIEATGTTITIRNSVLANDSFGEGNLWRRGNTVVNLYSSLLSPPDVASEINGANSNNLFQSVDFTPPGRRGCTQPIGYLADTCVETSLPVTAQTVTVNAGSSSNPTDQRGFDRDDGNGVDMGAAELQPPLVEMVTTHLALAEGNTGTTPFVFTIRRHGDLRGTTQVSWQVHGQGSHPVDAADFGNPTLPFGFAFFNTNEADTTITVSVVGDTAAEYDEGFRLVLTQITDGQAGSTTSASAIVLNDDSAFSVPTLSLTALSVDQPEGSVLYSPHRFRVTRTGDASGFCSFTLTVQGTGLDPIEQDDLYSGTLGQALSYQLTPFETTADLEVRIAADSEYEGDEQFKVSLGNPSGCLINNFASEVSSTVFNDDSLFSIMAVDADKMEGDSGTTEMRFRVQRAGATSATASVSWSVVGTGANPADAADFAGGVLPVRPLTMGPGVLSTDILIAVQGDVSVEADESFEVRLGNPRSGGSVDPLGASAAGRIRNDDSTPPTGGRIFADGFE
ncbi:MAG: hypothetical protein KatS3mg126_1131 [Lysobacteraceae bacterium]|nr:MAG: hypothetical protein KatS3mg126_1131 [Xanthomonadaceae bacterium]